MFKNLDKRQKTELSITAIGIIFLIFLVIGNIQRIQKKKIAIIKTGTKMSPSLSAPISLERGEIKESMIKDSWGRDPFFFTTSGMAGSGLEGLVLNGIVWDKDNPYAIINDDVVKIGDKLDDMRVVEISEKSVTLEQDGKRYTLQLSSEY